ncbi:MAG: hypothetical protein IJQ80_01695, partial [Clostridia bacterium]|nr:hypothetical protein [Clostridia bacterium]
LIINCLSAVDITTSKTHSGGIAGSNWLEASKTRYCVSTGTLTWTGASSAYAYIGGITGENRWGAIDHCAMLGDVLAQNTTESWAYAGILIGREMGSTTDCYYLNTAETAGAVNSGSATPKTADELKAIGQAAYDAGYTVYGLALGAVRKYTITWKLDENTVIDTTSVAYGTVPTHADAVKAEDDDYTYEFAGWDTTPVAVTGDATYTATFTTVPKHVHDYVYAGCEWKDIEGAYTAVYTYACECGDEITENIVPEASEFKGVLTYTADDGQGNVETTSVELSYTVTYNDEVQPVAYKWGEICTLKADGTSRWYINGKPVADGTATYMFAVTENSVVTTEASEEVEQQAVVSATLTTPVSGKATFNAKWSLPAGSEVNSVKIYRGTTKADKTISAETLISAGAATKVNLYARNGDYTLNISGLTATKYQHVVIAIDYTLNGERKTLTSDVQKVLPNGQN